MGEVRRLSIIRRNSEVEEFEPVDLLLDSGATYSILFAVSYFQLRP